MLRARHLLRSFSKMPPGSAHQTEHEPLRTKEEWQEISQSRTNVRWKRLIERTNPFHQSSWNVNVRCTERPNDYKTRRARWTLLFRDWFDYILSFRTSLLISILAVFYTILLIIWALFYMAIDCKESAPRLNFQEAFAFSLQTATTVSTSPL
jgi:hypothetical protein